METEDTEKRELKSLASQQVPCLTCGGPRIKRNTTGLCSLCYIDSKRKAGLDLSEAISLYESGMSVKAAAQHLGFDPSYVAKSLKKIGYVVIRHRENFDVERAINMYNSGTPVTQICSDLDVSYASVYKRFRQYHVILWQKPIYRALEAAIRTRRQNLKGSYNITLEDYCEILYVTQKGRCPLCQAEAPLLEEMFENRFWPVDHDHSCCPERSRSCGKCIRGVPCDPCNKGLGHLRDDIAVLQNAIEYLQKGTVPHG